MTEGGRFGVLQEEKQKWNKRISGPFWVEILPIISRRKVEVKISFIDCRVGSRPETPHKVVKSDNRGGWNKEITLQKTMATDGHQTGQQGAPVTSRSPKISLSLLNLVNDNSPLAIELEAAATSAFHPSTSEVNVRHFHKHLNGQMVRMKQYLDEE